MQTQPEASVERSVADLCGSLAHRQGMAVTGQTALDDLGLDSIDMAEVAVAVEERFGIRLADADPATLRTVGDVVRVIEGHGERRPRIQRGLGRWQGWGKRIGGPAVRAYCRLRVQGAEHVPPTGPVIVAANHRSMWDLPITVVACPRRLLYMGKRELFGDPLRRWLWWILGGFPVRREINDLRAIDEAVAIVERGDGLGLYPEGTRSFDGPMLPFLRGAAWVALGTGTSIVPCAIDGSQRHAPGRPRFGKRALVRFGPPIPVERVADPAERLIRAQEVTARLRQVIAEMLA